VKISAARLRRFVARMRGARMAVVGDWMLDRYVWGDASRLSPEAAVPVVDFVAESESLGGAGNVAANLAALGARVVPFGALGDDTAGERFLSLVRARKMPPEGLLVEPARVTTLKTRIVARQQQIVRVDRETRSPLDGALEERLIRRIIGALGRVDALVVSDYDKGVITEALAERVLGACRRLRLPVFVKPKWSRLPTYRGATVIVCNRAEAGFLTTRALEDDAGIEQAGRALLAHFGCPALVITRGPDGMSVFEQDSPQVLHVPATTGEAPAGAREARGRPGRRKLPAGRQVFDVTGAGDTVLAALALAVVAGAGVGEAAFLANAAAGVVVGKLGAATLAPAELAAALDEWAKERS
jgi:rfaE bifunctional protein kinase chain/domain